MDRRAEQARVLALVKAATGHIEWHRVADTLEEVGSAGRVMRGEWTGYEPEDARLLHQLAAAITDSEVETFCDLITTQDALGSRLITVLDPEYPPNLHDIFNRPPFVWVRGELLDSDSRAVAVVGTRAASQLGLRAAASLASELVSHGVTVVSGLAEGIDTAAHRGALEAGGRTVAVLGTGINLVYPPSNTHLASQIVECGALLSQFWPSAPPTQFSFPMRNVVMSGMAIGTVVVEASATSGAKMQARLALEHGKHLFLMESLLKEQEWARRYSNRPGAVVVTSTDEILDVLEGHSQPQAEQLRLA
jgi:DNA processing protein